jgi:hypothetical protein
MVVHRELQLRAVSSRALSFELQQGTVARVTEFSLGRAIEGACAAACAATLRTSRTKACARYNHTSVVLCVSAFSAVMLFWPPAHLANTPPDLRTGALSQGFDRLCLLPSAQPLPVCQEFVPMQIVPLEHESECTPREVSFDGRVANRN